MDYGCGLGAYVDVFAQAGVEAWGVEGSYEDERRPLIRKMNLCEPLDVVPVRSRFAVCLEVAEHIPVEYESVLLDNVCRNAPFVALSWAVRGQVGLGHVNCRDNDEVLTLMRERGYEILPEESARVREAVRQQEKCLWFVNTFLFFQRLGTSRPPSFESSFGFLKACRRWLPWVSRSR